ncbi:SMP-30/gluconolactonase/LRE family protein [Sinomonas terrae]|uniref:SMP-30/gluconolactonase/LRE family protein n=1 Tax=Sinomonas terrae TaxID=2908838 RepID=A0ABS9U6H5_9MICC|nr:SMP-30/gluconolactonase/LRE family protein [Sinomonas terrae]MCH6472112.1 SMP-30/gluconolactonase/LRE family protein [Sinomonas terrae]
MRDYPAPRIASRKTHQVGEGPIWDPIREEVLWVDIPASAVMRAELTREGSLQIIETILFPDTAGAVTISESGELLVAGRERLYTRDRDGVIHPGTVLLPSGTGRRLNDGKPDPGGHFVVGSLSLRQRSQSGSEILVRVEADGAVTTIDSDLTLSNGLAWSTDQASMYSVDTNTRRVYVRDYDASSGAIGDREVFIELPEGLPDGLCVDAEDHLWLAVYGLGQVNRYAPSGELVGRITVPAPRVTCVAFVGPSLDTLVITTATAGLSEADLADYPLSGQLFTIQPGVSGAPSALWSPTP